MAEFLEQFVINFAAAMHAVDARRPVAVRAAEKGVFRPGIGPHPEDAVVEKCLSEMARLRPDKFGAYQRGVPYRHSPRSRCDLCIGTPPDWDWAIEAKLLRFLGDNGKPNGNMLMHILSPYAQDRSALTDCTKLAHDPLASRKAVVIFGFEHEDWPLDPAIECFELLASKRARIGSRLTASTPPLVHPVHSSARIFAWELTG